MTSKNRGKGAGGAQTNENGLVYQKQIVVMLKQSLASLGVTMISTTTLGKYKVNDELYLLLRNGVNVGYFGTGRRVYQALSREYRSEIKGSLWVRRILSRVIIPDAFLFIPGPPPRLIIFEIKWQQRSGSVDEKLQTAPYKIAIFEKLLKSLTSPYQVNIMYCYLLSEWFKDKRYNDVREYYESNPRVSLYYPGFEDILDISRFFSEDIP